LEKEREEEREAAGQGDEGRGNGIGARLTGNHHTKLSSGGEGSGHGWKGGR